MPPSDENSGVLFELPRKFWYLDLVVVAAMVILAYAVLFFL